MPRLPTSLILDAYKTNPLLLFLLRPCRDLPFARNELRWLREHAIALARRKSRPRSKGWRVLLRRFCEERGRGKPLQYILGSQPFGDVDILCRPGVLIPRPETEAYTTHLATLIRSRLRQNPQCPRNSNPRNATAPLRILDLCTGTGCIPLLLHSLLSPHTSNLILLGVDICPKAIALARQNLHWNIAQGNISASANKQVHFARGDILAHHLKQPEEGLNTLNDVFNKHGGGKWDILISNPPYISPRGFNKDTARSVRAFEPRLALVPSRITSFAKPCRPGREIQRSDDQQGDVFYHSLLAIAERVNAKIVVMEVGDLEQGRRVVALMGDGDGWEGGEIWRDWVDGRGSVKEGEVWEVGGREVRVRGEGNGRAVICFRGCAWNGVEA